MPLTAGLDPSVPLPQLSPSTKVDKKTVGNPPPDSEADQMGRTSSRSRCHDFPRGAPGACGILAAHLAADPTGRRAGGISPQPAS